MAKFRDRIELKNLKEKIASEDKGVRAKTKEMLESICPVNRRFPEPFEVKIFKTDNGDILEIQVWATYSGDGIYTDAQKTEYARRKQAFDKLLAAAHEAGFQFSENIHCESHSMWGHPNCPDTSWRIGAILDDNYEQKLKAMGDIIQKSAVVDGPRR